MLFDEDEDPAADLDLYSDALAFWRKKAGLTNAEVKEATLAQREVAETAADLTQLEQVTTVWEAIEDAIEDGSTLADFKRDARAALEDFSDAQIETIFRTNVQTAYSAGRQKQQSDPAVLEAFPYWQFVAVLDGRTSEICSECADTILRADNPWWDEHQPPLHHNCRSTVRALDEEEAEKLGVDSEGATVNPREGFGGSLVEDQSFEPDLSEFPDELLAERSAKFSESEE